MGVVKFEMDGVTKLVTTSELLRSALLPDKLSHVSRRGHLVILRSQFNIILRPQGISTYCKAVRLCVCSPPSQWDSNFVLCVYSDPVMEFWGTVMIQIINNNKLFARVSARAKAA